MKSYGNCVRVEIASRPSSTALRPSRKAEFCVALSSNTWIFHMCFGAETRGLWGGPRPLQGVHVVKTIFLLILSLILTNVCVDSVSPCGCHKLAQPTWLHPIRIHHCTAPARPAVILPAGLAPSGGSRGRIQLVDSESTSLQPLLMLPHHLLDLIHPLASFL